MIRVLKAEVLGVLQVLYGSGFRLLCLRFRVWGLRFQATSSSSPRSARAGTVEGAHLLLLPCIHLRW